MAKNRAANVEQTDTLPEGFERVQAMPWELGGSESADDPNGVEGFFNDLSADLLDEVFPEDVDERETRREPEADLEEDAESDDEFEDDEEVDEAFEEPEDEEEGEVDEEEDDFEEDDGESEEDEDDPQETPEKQGLRLADYTRKMQKLAEERKEARAEREQYATERQAYSREYAERLEALDKALTDLSPPEPNWDELRERDPAEFAAQWADHQRRTKAMEQIRAERQRELEKADTELFQREAAKLMEKLPAWKDEATRISEQEAILEYAVNDLGFTKDEVEGVRDHRVFLMLRNAWKGAQREQKVDEVKKEVQKKSRKRRRTTLKPGARQSQGTRKRKRSANELEARREAMRRSGGTDDRVVAGVFEHLLNEGIIE